MVAEQPAKIRYSGSPQMTPGGLEVMSFHLHRFLAAWLEQHQLERVWISVGFEGSALSCVTFDVSRHQSAPMQGRWSFEDLCQTYRGGDGHLYLESSKGKAPLILSVVPILDRPASGGQASIVVGFVLLPKAATLTTQEIADLQLHTFEAIAAARRNAARLFFDEHKEQGLKTLLYQCMEHLPEWCGADCSAMMILTSSLETMTLDEVSSQFNILAERIFFAPQDDQAPERLVGMTLKVNEDEDNLLSRAFLQQREDVEMPYQIFWRLDDEVTRWCAMEQWDEGLSQSCTSFHGLKTRQRERMIVLVPLVTRDDCEAELLGFLAISYRERVVLPSSVGHLLSELAEHLTPMLRYSSLYTLSARKLWILRRLRREAEHYMQRQEMSPEEGLEAMLTVASELIQQHVDVPSFAMGYLKHDEQQRRYLRFIRPHGWAHYEHLNLLVDVPEAQRVDSGVSTLAVRLRQPLVLAGGHQEGDRLEFKNSLFVHEVSGRLVDRRAPGISEPAASDGWVPLGRYYKPARATAYATLAYPITFGERVLGVVTIEVDKETNWLWWTGFGGHLFWQLVASELANACYAFGIRG